MATSRPRMGTGARMKIAYTALAMSLLVLLVAGCSSNTAPRDVTVRLFVDSDADRAWDEGDVPLPNVVVYLDEDLSAITDSEGRVTFEDISGNQHTVTLDEEGVEDLAAHSVICDAPSQTVRFDEDTEVLFCFRAAGFLEVDVSEEDEGE
ncbi:hypothetical protein ACFLTM_02450 [Candidatus Bipolaricaulota bacterium]